MDFKAFLLNHLYYLIWKGSLLQSSRATACATGGLNPVDMLSLSPLEAPLTPWASCAASSDLFLNLCHSKPAFVCVVFRVAFSKKILPASWKYFLSCSQFLSNTFFFRNMYICIFVFTYPCTYITYIEGYTHKGQWKYNVRYKCEPHVILSFIITTLKSRERWNEYHLYILFTSISKNAYILRYN